MKAALLAFALGLAGLACSTTESSPGSAPAGLATQPVSIAAVDVSYAESFPADRRARAAELRIAERCGAKLRSWLLGAGLMGGPDRLAVALTEFRLPDAGTRWLTGSFKGSDFLAADVAVREPDARSVVSATVRTQLGALDRSIAENYSADAALENMIDNLTWAIAFELVPAGPDEKLLELGKAQGVVPAIQELGWRGKLDYGEVLKYSAMGTFKGDLALATCASSLAKPDWLPAFIWDFPLVWMHSSCESDADEHLARAKQLVPVKATAAEPQV